MKPPAWNRLSVYAVNSSCKPLERLSNLVMWGRRRLGKQLEISQIPESQQVVVDRANQNARGGIQLKPARQVHAANCAQTLFLSENRTAKKVSASCMKGSLHRRLCTGIIFSLYFFIKKKRSYKNYMLFTWLLYISLGNIFLRRTKGVAREAFIFSAGCGMKTHTLS